MSIYDEVGGAPAIGAAVDAFYLRVLDDELLAPYFDGVDMSRQKAHMRAFLATAVGGPEVYAGRDMASAHTGLGVTDAAFGRVVEHLVATLTELGVAPGTIGAIGDRLAPLKPQIVTA